MKRAKHHSRFAHFSGAKLVNKALITIAVSLFLFFVFNKEALPNLAKNIASFQNRSSQMVDSSQNISSASSNQKLSPTPTKSPAPSDKISGFCLNVPVLLYHHIQPLETAQKEGQVNLTVDNKVFEAQMAYLNSAGYKTISAEQLAQALLNHQALPAKSIVITMDDGYSDIYTYAFPIIRQYNIAASLMIPTGLIENPGYLTWAQLKEMVATGLVFAYDHTWSHASLGSLPPEKIESEILTAKKQLEENLGKAINIFTYPYGSKTPYIEALLRANGFIAAFSTNPGFTQCDSFIMGLHRNHIGDAPLSFYGL